jgi:replicative DNA helicase
MNDDTLSRVPPHDLEAEKSMLGAILIRPEAYDVAAGIVDGADFYLERHRLIFHALGELTAARAPIDAVTLLSQLNSRAELVGGADYIAELGAFVPTAANVGHYARTVHEKAMLRDVITTSTQLAADAFEATDVPEFMAGAEYEIARIASRQIARPEPSKADTLATALWKIEHGQKDSVLTGFAPLDQSFGGFNAGHLTVLAARTSKGKTAFATNVAINAARAGFAVAFFTLEMTAEEMWLRALGCEGQVDLFSARRRGYKYGEKERIETARTTLESLPLQMLYRPSMRPRDLRVECRRLARAMGPLKLIIVDYFNLMRGDRREKDRWREMQEAVLALKDLAGELGLPILLLSQLNRDTDESAPPALSNLRDTGAMEEHASNVLFIWQRPPKGDAPMTYNDWDDIEVIIGKQRNGPPGLRVPMQFCKRWGAFVAR